MKKTINSKRYDTTKCEVLGEYVHHNNGNYSGTTYLLRASDNQLLVHCDSNGQDYYLPSYVCIFNDTKFSIDDFDMTDEQENRCAELGFITIVQ